MSALEVEGYEPGTCECGCGERTTIARYSDARYGAVNGQPKRFISGHNVRVRPRPVRPAEERFSLPDVRDTEAQGANRARTRPENHRARRRRCLMTDWWETEEGRAEALAAAEARGAERAAKAIEAKRGPRKRRYVDTYFAGYFDGQTTALLEARAAAAAARGAEGGAGA